MAHEERHATLGNYVYENLVKRIADEEFAEGSRLPTESVLVKQYKVSRPVIREALALLKDDGFISTRRGAGSFLVRMPEKRVFSETPIKDFEDIQRCYDFRYVVEGETAYRAATRHDAADMRQMQKAYNATLKADVEPGVKEMEVDMEFHLSIARATHNRFFHEALCAIHRQMINSMILISQLFADKDHHLQIKRDYHGAVLRAIETGDAEAARLNMQLHILNTRDYLFQTKEHPIKY